MYPQIFNLNLRYKRVLIAIICIVSAAKEPENAANSACSVLVFPRNSNSALSQLARLSLTQLGFL